MKRKVLNILFALVLVLGMSLVMAAPAAAATAVTSVWVSFATTGNNIDTAAVYTIYFTPTTAMLRGVDTVTVIFPDNVDTTLGADNFDISGAQTNAAYYTFGTDLVACTSVATISGYRVKVTTPIDLAAGTATKLVISASAVIKTATPAGTFYIKLATSKDTTFVLSDAFFVDGSVVSAIAAHAAPSSLVAGAASDYYFKFTSESAVTTAGTITVEFPLLTYLPATIATSAVYAGDTAGDSDPIALAVTVDTTKRTVTVMPGEALAADTLNYVYFTSDAGILNPTTAGDKQIFVWTSTDGQKVASATNIYTIVAGTATQILVVNGLAGLAGTLYSDDATMISMYSSQIYVTLADQYGNSKAAAAAVTVTTSSPSGTIYTNAATDGTGAFTAAPTISVDVATPSADVGQQVYYKNSTAGTYILTFSATDYTSDTWTVTVAPGVALYDSAGNLINTFAPTVAVAETGDGSPAQKYASDYINDAITASFPGDTIKLGNGIYEVDNDSFISLNKAVTLTSLNGAAYTTIRNTVEIDKAILVGISGTAATPVVIDGFTFQRLRATVDIDCAVRNDGYDYLTVRNCIFNYIIPDEAGSEEAVIWVRTGTAIITSCTISTNTFSNCVGFNAIDSGNGRTGVIQFYDTSGTAALTGVTVSGNTLTDCNDYGIVLGGGGVHSYAATISNNTITRGYSSIAMANHVTAVSITGNTITRAYRYGITVTGGDNTLVTIKNNTITGTAGTLGAIYIPNETDATAVVVQYNDLYSNNGYAIQSSTTAVFDCQYNWYGSASGPGTTVSSVYVDTTPWLHVSKATVVADNAAYIAQSVTLGVGLHTLSTPALLITTADQISELMPSYATNMEYCYKYVDGVWSNIGTGVLTPCHAYYIKMTVADSIVLKYDANEYSTPTKALTAGWNLISAASLSTMTEINAVASVLKTAANLPGYSQVISPSMNTASWSYSAGAASTAGSMYVGEGYWIYMQNASTLAGFTIFPLVPDLD